MINRKIFSVIFLLATAIFLSGFLSSYSSYSSSYFSSNGLQGVSQMVCQPGQDLVIQISPTGCTPTIVRSDLLEEIDVPVLCPLSATKINPLVDISSIDSISFSGTYSKQISGVGFYPARAALGTQGTLNSGILSNIGYVVVVLKKQVNESSMPDYVSGNLTANVKYNVNNAFGIGSVLFSLPEFASESDWSARKYQYSFWNGKGYLRADGITNDGATISLYTDTGKVSDVNLKLGQTSNSIYLPGLECQAGLKLTLASLNNPDTVAKIRINADVAEVAKGESFLNNKCSVQDLQNNGIVQKVTIKCQEDSGTSTFLLSVNPSITLNIGGKDKQANLGDWLYDSGDKSVYLGYIGMNGNSLDSKNLFVYLFAKLKSQKTDNLTSEELSSVNLLVNDLTNAKIKPAGIIDKISDAIKPFVGLTNRVGKYIASGQLVDGINFGDKTQNFLETKVYITSFSGAQDADLDSSVKEQYTSAKQDYETIKTQYASESYSPGDTTYGEEASYNEIAFAFNANQKATASALCAEFTKNYPNSQKPLTTYCSYQLSSSQQGGQYVTINKKIYQISFDGIYEPSESEYSIVVNANTPTGMHTITLDKNQVEYLSSTGNDYLQLVSIDGDNVSTIQASVTVPSTTTSSGVNSGTVKLTLNNPVNFANGYTFTLTKVNLQKVARVSVNSNINNAGTTASFNFKIGIEKRAISLSPDEVKKQIASLNGEISKWQSVSDTVGNVSQGLKTACLAAGVALVAKNFFLNTGGTGIARTAIMTGTAGWTQKCTGLVASKTYTSMDDCFLKNSDEIDKEVNTVSKVIEAQNAQKKQLEAAATTPGLFGEQVVNTKEYMQKDIPAVNSYLQTLPSSIPDPNKKGQAIDMTTLLNKVITTDGYSNGMYTSDQLNDVELYTRILNDPSSSEDLKSLANARIYSDLSTIQTNSVNFAQAAELAKSMNNVNPSQIGFISGKDVVIKDWEGITLSATGKTIGTLSGDTPVYVSKAYDGNTYLFILDNSLGTQKMSTKLIDGNLQIYNYNTGDLVTKDSSPIYGELVKTSFQTRDASSYHNTYKNAKLTYYETEPYVGLPAIVPFDTKNGWYAATQPVVSNTATNAYQLNGKVTSFSVCNVGANGIQEFQKGGDDTCEMINTGTGQPYNQFPGITSTTEAAALINKANQAIEAASKAYTSGISGKVDILGTKVDVGTPAVNIPQFQCQDFMSPKDCSLLFNLCDPVICPSSRCNLGGAYPVKDVIQSGVIGSIVLCFPNVKEGIILPVCLTGIQAGIDGYLSVQKSVRDCLNESLITGKTVGICDEIQSIYLCEFFWKQALPIANIAIPNVISTILGQNVRGGGEYLGVANAWSTAQKSFDYFINSYGTNSRDAFTARSTDVIQDEVCKLYTSAVVPSSADLLNALTAPDSPVQFTGHFEEIAFSTATSPATSQYKVYYHIYAGKDAGAYYQVYLKGDASSSYYKDTSQTFMVDSGYVPVGSQVDGTKNPLAVSGYKQLCINVNGQEECGFSTVSTSFGVNYLSDLYVSNQANQTNINSASQCISDYNNGIIRICATADPGQGTDPNSGTASARWQQVGYCDTQDMKCWIDTQSINNAMKYATDANATISSLSSTYQNLLASQNGYTPEQFSSDIEKIQSASDADKITLISSIIDKVVLSNQKAQLLLLRGDAYAEIFKVLFAKLPKPAGTTPQSSLSETIAGASGTTGTSGTGASETQVTQGQILQISDAGQRMISTANILNGTIVSGENSNRGYNFNDNCWTAMIYAYTFAGVSQKLCGDGGYADTDGKTYTFKNEHTGGKTVTVNIGTTQRCDDKSVCVLVADGVTEGRCTLDSKASSDNKLDAIQPGYLLSILWNDQWGHNVIFLGWADKENRIAQLFDWNAAIISSGKTDKNGKQCAANDLMKDDKGNLIKDKNGNYYCKIYRIYTADLNDDANPVFMYWVPYIPSASAVASVPEVPKQTFAPPDVTNTIAEQTTTAENNIWKQAGILSGGSITSAKFVSQVLVSVGISGIEVAGTVSSTLPSSVSYLVSIIEKRSDFQEVSVNSDLKKGDIVILGKGCQNDYAIGIFSSFSSDNKQISLYTNLGDYVNLETISFNTQIDNGVYVYKAYRYIGDLSSDEKNNIPSVRASWTLDSAITRVSALKGSYTDNKLFVDQLIFDGILTEKDCGDVRGTNSFVGSFGGSVLQKDMLWLKNLLLTKKVNSGTQTSTSTTSSIPSTSYNSYASTFEKYASINHPTLGTTPLSSNDFKALLAAIAQQNNWGASTRGGSDWLMGYNSGDTNYQGVDKQISTVSGILKSVLEGSISNPQSAYYSCISTTVLSDRLHCILSVLKTGKVDSPGILGIGANTEGNAYADGVLTLWNSWKTYFNSVSGNAH